MRNQKSNVEGQYRVLTIIWLALLFSQLLFIALVFFAKPEVFRFDFSKPLLGNNAMMTGMFAALAISNLGMSFVLSRKYINQAIAEQKTELVQTATIIGCALCEAISLFGVVMAFAFSYQYFFLWCALGIMGTILHFPKRDNLVAASYKE
jgi:F0F1-type ATP synthase membrane subunit c/vacuolar-type H+-ATPase subunit K